MPITIEFYKNPFENKDPAKTTAQLKIRKMKVGKKVNFF
jgi:hypothetical protein